MPIKTQKTIKPNKIKMHFVCKMHGLTTIYLENPTIYLADGAFLCGHIEYVYYGGTVEQYNSKGQTWTRGKFNNTSTLPVKLYCTDSDEPIILS